MKLTTAKERVTMRAYLARWQKDAANLEKLFGVYDQENADYRTEIQRNLQTAIAYAEMLLAMAKVEDAQPGDALPVCGADTLSTASLPQSLTSVSKNRT